MPEPGLYRHYKGGFYQMHFIAKHSETGEDLVIYSDLVSHRLQTLILRITSLMLSKSSTPKSRKLLPSMSWLPNLRLQLRLRLPQLQRQSCLHMPKPKQTPLRRLLIHRLQRLPASPSQ